MRVAIVTPRYGPDVVGGAERLAGHFAREVAQRGWSVEVWTTCAKSHYTWENAHPAGTETQHGGVVRRFPITRWDPARRAALEVRLAHLGQLPLREQYAWLESGAHSTPLYEHVARHGGDFEVVVTLPYATPLAHYAAWAAGPQARIVVWPCLHDEPYATMEPVRLLLESAWGVMFLSPEERELAVRRLRMNLRHHGTLGGGVTLPAQAPPTQGARDHRDLLYVGRLEEGKGLAVLYDHVGRYAAEHGDLRLVVLGKGPLEPPKHPAFEYRGFVSEEEKARAYGSALTLCQPSVNESFSITLMESWLAGRPGLVHGECPVTRGHVERSKGGLWYRTYDEFAGAVTWLRTHPALATRMGENGRRYVSANYAWDTIVARFERLVRCWEGEGA